MLGVDKPSPYIPLSLWRDIRTGLTLWLHFLAVMSGSHRLGGPICEPCSFRRPAAEFEVSADIGYHESYGESVPSLPTHVQGLAGLGGCVWA